MWRSWGARFFSADKAVSIYLIIYSTCVPYPHENEIHYIMANSDILSASIGAGASVIDSALGLVGSEINYKHNKHLQWEGHNQALIRQRDAQQAAIEQWERETKYNSYPEQMRRLQEAGLNTSLVYGGGSTGDAAGSASMSGPAGASSPSVAPPNIRFNPSLATAFSDILLKDSERSLNERRSDTEKTVQSLNTASTLLTQAKTANEDTQGAILSLQKNLLEDTYDFKVSEVERSLELLQEQVNEARTRNQVLPDMLDAELMSLRVDAFCKYIQTESQVKLNDAQIAALRWSAKVSANAYWSGLPDAIVGRHAAWHLNHDQGRLYGLAQNRIGALEGEATSKSWLPWIITATSFIPNIGGLIGKGLSLLFGVKSKIADRMARMVIAREKNQTILQGRKKSQSTTFYDSKGNPTGGSDTSFRY